VHGVRELPVAEHGNEHVLSLSVLNKRLFESAKMTVNFANVQDFKLVDATSWCMSPYTATYIS